MRFLVLFSILISININAQFKVNLKKVQSISIKIDTSQAINVGKPIIFDVFAKLKNGKIKSIANHPKLSISGDGIKKIIKGTLLILPNNNCNKDSYSLVAVLTDGKFTIEDRLNIKLNYKGNLVCDFSGKEGKNGTKGSKQGIVGGTIRNRDGKDGNSGAAGTKGENGMHLKAFIRPDTLSGLILVDIFNIDSNQMYCYKMLNIDKNILINVSGGKGGNGGDGRIGQNGKNEIEKSNGKIKPSGKGGNGGFGGSAGNGGDGGSVEVFVHSSLQDKVSKISIKNQGG